MTSKKPRLSSKGTPRSRNRVAMACILLTLLASGLYAAVLVATERMPIEPRLVPREDTRSPPSPCVNGRGDEDVPNPRDCVFQPHGW